ncbi:HAD-IA family hydrolase [Phormidium sp. LEGE 05292]|uniref:HAD family hydrolase n=1 Tax=[Phormidium] sp. LEGE 05292 TaxID=767427 RepID=UPI00187EE5D5|nr:HAD-IA family hydrolase [Phormidium sp. LEGE 05292]MBE9227406.1 HAD-IA family hydrolase [Phormidium sp. LEGE 05292]
MLAGILFDLDGTLVNTDPLHFQAWQEMLLIHGLEIDNVFYQTRISGRLNPIIIQDILPHLTLEQGEKFAEDKEARFRELAPLLKPLCGLERILDWTKEHGLKRGLVTNAPRKNVDFLLEILELAEIFDAIFVAEEDVSEGKPDPAIYKLALERLNITPELALAFEDSPSGIRSAVGAGIRTIGIASTHDPQKLYDLGAFKVIPNFIDPSLWSFLMEKMQVLPEKS